MSNTVHAAGVIETAEKTGKIIKEILEDPLSLHMARQSKTAKVGYQKRWAPSKPPRMCFEHFLSGKISSYGN